MSFMDLVTSRRSLRKYSDRPVPRDVIDLCCEAARVAPSACNSQPWHFVIADSDPMRQEVANAAFSGVHKMCAFAAAAPVLAVVCAGPLSFMARFGALTKGVPFTVSDTAIAGEHFILQAQEKGLGTCWLGWFDAMGVARVLNLPKSKHPMFIIAMGYPPKGGGYTPFKRKSLEEMRTYA